MTQQPGHSRRPWLIGGAFLVAVIAAAGALGMRLSGSEGVVITPSTSYTEGVAGTWQRVNPIYSSANEVDDDLVHLIFAGLLKLGPDQAPRPDLADLPEVSNEGRTYTFRLKSDLKWQDGQPLTSADVLFTVQRIQDGGFKGEEALADAWDGVVVETPDVRTVVFHLKEPSAPFLARNATLGILPQHLLSGLTADELYNAPFNARPVGAGPYKLDALHDDRAVLTAYRGYHDGSPSIDTFTVRFYDDYPSLVRAAGSGEVDGFLFRDTPSEAQATELSKLRGMKASQLQRSAYLILYLNNDQANFVDARVRRAVSLAIDRRSITEATFFGAATPSSSAIPPGSWAYSEDYDRIESNLEEARKLLQEAGWVPNPGTGILVREGEEFRMTIRTDNDPVRMAVAAAVASQLQPLGIRATVSSTSFAVLRRDFLQERRYDAAITGWDQGADPDPYFGWHSSQTGTAGLNIANFADIVVDELIAKARTTSDVQVRQEQYRQFQEKWDELAPGVVIAYPRYTYVHKSGLSGPEADVLVTGAQRFWNVAKWKV